MIKKEETSSRPQNLEILENELFYVGRQRERYFAKIIGEPDLRQKTYVSIVQSQGLADRVRKYVSQCLLTLEEGFGSDPDLVRDFLKCWHLAYPNRGIEILEGAIGANCIKATEAIVVSLLGMANRGGINPEFETRLFSSLGDGPLVHAMAKSKATSALSGPLTNEIVSLATPSWINYQEMLDRNLKIAILLTRLQKPLFDLGESTEEFMDPKKKPSRNFLFVFADELSKRFDMTAPLGWRLTQVNQWLLGLDENRRGKFIAEVPSFGCFWD